MSYKLEKPYTEEQRADFIVEYNHQQGLKIEETETALIALEANELIIDGEVQIDSDYESKQDEIEKQAKLQELKKQLDDLDKKHIRVMCEPSMKTETQSWLEYYNEQIMQIRQVMAEL